MSKLKFTFEGEAEDLLSVLRHLSSRPSAPEYDVEPPYEPTDPMLNAPIRPHVLASGWRPTTAPPAMPSNADQVQAAVAAAARVAEAKLAEAKEPHPMDPLSPAVAGEPVGTEVNIFKTQWFDRMALKPEAWDEFVKVIQAWAKNFRSPEEPQVDRLKLLTDMGRSRWAIHILRHIAAHRSLQGAVHAALGADDLDLVAEISGNIVQCCHMAMPDLDGCFDHGTKWRRDIEARIVAQGGTVPVSSLISDAVFSTVSVGGV